MSDIWHAFPFSAVASQGQFKLALLLTAVNPLVGGVLISGPRGSAKSTLATGLADILPKQPGKHNRFVTLPLSASEEMLTGTLNLQQVLDEKKVEFKPGLLAKAHNGVLYVDEVNLLPDNLVDQLLDVAASGVNNVERDGISHQHPANFILLGTMNPDEGELRAQLIDRFGLCVSLSNQYSLEERIEIVKLREAFDKNPSSFIQQFSLEQSLLTDNIVRAQGLFPSIECPEECRRLIAQRCSEARVDGLRADIVWTQAALANAAIEQRSTVIFEDVLTVEDLVLNHRRNSDPDIKSNQPDDHQKPFSRPIQDSKNTSKQGDWGAMEGQRQLTKKLANTALLDGVKGGAFFRDRVCGMNVKNKGRSGARGLRVSAQNSTKINWFSSLLANIGTWPLDTLRFYRKRTGRSVIHLVLIDTSGSVLANQSFAKAKGLILQVAEQAYCRRERLTLLGFGNQEVSTLLNHHRAPKTILDILDNIQAGGGTPLQEALNEAVRLQHKYRTNNVSVMFKTYILTDGRISQCDIGPSKLEGDTVVVDIEQSQVKRGKAKKVASMLNARYLALNGSVIC